MIKCSLMAYRFFISKNLEFVRHQYHEYSQNKVLTNIFKHTAFTTVMNKNAAEVDIAPASGKITKNVEYRSRAISRCDKN